MAEAAKRKRANVDQQWSPARRLAWSRRLAADPALKAALVAAGRSGAIARWAGMTAAEQAAAIARMQAARTHTVRVVVYVRPDQAERLAAAAERLKVSRSVLARQLIDAGLAALLG